MTSSLEMTDEDEDDLTLWAFHPPLTGSFILYQKCVSKHSRKIHTHYCNGRDHRWFQKEPPVDYRFGNAL